MKNILIIIITFVLFSCNKKEDIMPSSYNNNITNCNNIYLHQTSRHTQNEYSKIFNCYQKKCGNNQKGDTCLYTVSKIERTYLDNNKVDTVIEFDYYNTVIVDDIQIQISNMYNDETRNLMYDLESAEKVIKIFTFIYNKNTNKIELTYNKKNVKLYYEIYDHQVLQRLYLKLNTIETFKFRINNIEYKMYIKN